MGGSGVDYVGEEFDKHCLLLSLWAKVGVAMSTREAISIGRGMVELAIEKEITFLAGSIAFFAFVSLVPAMVLILAIGSLLGGEAFATGIVGLVESSLSEEGTEVLRTALADTSGLAGASILGLIVLVWSTLKVFRALDIAFNRIYQVDADTSLFRQLLNGTIVALSIMTALMVLLLVRMTIPWLTIPYANWLGVPLVMLGLIVVLFPIYFLLPPVPVSLREVLPGALAAVFGLTLLQELFAFYASHAGQYQAYGFIGAVLLFLLWLYFGSTVLLGGVVVNASLADLRHVPESASRLAFPVTPHFDTEVRERTEATTEVPEAETVSEDEPEPLKPR
jgi:membrane protein